MTHPSVLIPVQLLPGAIYEILASSTETGVLTVSDRYGLYAATLDEFLPEEERRVVNRILRSVIRGRIRLEPTPVAA